MIDVANVLKDEAEYLLEHVCTKIPNQNLHLPGPDYVDRIYALSDRSPNVLRNLQHLIDHGRLGGTGYLSILPVDQGVEHTAAASFAPNPDFFDPENIIRLALEGGSSGVASTLGVLGGMSRKYAHRIPFVLKINHNELLTYPNKWDQVLFASVKQAFDMGAVAVGATVYFGAPESSRQLREVAAAFQYAHEYGMATILWSYLRNPAFKKDGTDYHVSADITGQANHLAATVEADIVKQKLPLNNGGFKAIGFSKTDPRIYTELCEDHPIDLCRWQVVNCYMGRAGLINSGGGSGGKRPARGRAYGGHQQAGRRYGVDSRPQGVPAAHGRRCGPFARRAGRVSGRSRDRGVSSTR